MNRTLAKLLAIAGLCMAVPASAADNGTLRHLPLDPVQFHDDGRVTKGGKTFATHHAWANSNEFIQGGYRCASLVPDVHFASPSDCTLGFTDIQSEYNPAGGTAWQIPVVFHVISNSNGTGNISDDLVRSQVEILNEDFRALSGTNGEGGTDVAVQFVLASVDPQGNATNGINRVTNSSWFNDSGDYQSALNWDTDRYLNIYTNTASGALGYAMFPQDAAGAYYDGVVILYSSVGRNSPNPPYNQGRTVTHEVGHYLGLHHTFNSGCGSAGSPYSTGDRIADTVAESSPHYNCTEGSSPCSGGGAKPIHNYMNYSVDLCMYEFSPEQMNRIRCSMVNYRPELYMAVDSNLPPTAAFNFIATGLSVVFTDHSSDPEGSVVAWDWQFGDGSSSTQENPTHEYSQQGSYFVTLRVTDDGGNSHEATVPININAPPFANFEYKVKGKKVEFTDLSTDQGGALQSWHWDFGDGAQGSSPDPTHTYDDYGTYEVKLTVTDDWGEPSVSTQSVKVKDPAEEDNPLGCNCSLSSPQRVPLGGAAVLLLALAGLLVRRRRRG